MALDPISMAANFKIVVVLVSDSCPDIGNFNRHQIYSSSGGKQIQVWDNGQEIKRIT